MHSSWPRCSRQVSASVDVKLSERSHLLPQPAERPRQTERVVERAAQIVLVQLGVVAVREAALVQLAVPQRQRHAVPEVELRVRGDGGRLDGALRAGGPLLVSLHRVAFAPPEPRADGEQGQGTAAEGVAPAHVPHRPLALPGLGREERPAHPLEPCGAGERVGQRERESERQVGAGRERGGAGLGGAQCRYAPPGARKFSRFADRQHVLEAGLEGGEVEGRGAGDAGAQVHRPHPAEQPAQRAAVARCRPERLAQVHGDADLVGAGVVEWSSAE